MGWLLVLFDLPVMTEDERKAATKFRNDLLEQGYLMLQYSVYAKCAVTFERKASLIRQIRKIAPGTGNIHCIFLTDAQWSSSVIISSGGEKSKRQIDKDSKNAEQLQFW